MASPDAIYILLVPLFVIIPMLVNMYLTYNADRNRIKLIVASLNSNMPDDLKESINVLAKTPFIMYGFTRSLMALTVIVIIGLSLLFILVNWQVTSNLSNVINNVMSMLSGLLAAIAGFYFGGRTSEEAVKKSSQGTGNKNVTGSSQTAEGQAKGENANKKASHEPEKKIDPGNINTGEGHPKGENANKKPGHEPEKKIDPGYIKTGEGQAKGENADKKPGQEPEKKIDPMK